MKNNLVQFVSYVECLGHVGLHESRLVNVLENRPYKGALLFVMHIDSSFNPIAFSAPCRSKSSNHIGRAGLFLKALLLYK